MDYGIYQKIVDIPGLHEGWRGLTVSHNIILQANEPESETETEDYLETSTLAEDIILIRFIEDHRQLDDIGLQHSTQIIWNSIFSWRQIMQHLLHNSYHFNFQLEQIVIDSNNGRAGDKVHISPRDVVDGLPDVTIRGEDNGNDDQVLCTVCYEPLRNGETAKQLPCTHLFHSHCIFQWFKYKINCPTCRKEPTSA